MSVDAITSTATGATATAGPIRGTKDEFLRLFMAQLQHQDPFAPTSGADMVAQLAQLSSVEQAKQTNDQLAALAAAQDSAAHASLSSLVGRDCAAQLGAVQLDGQAPVPPIEATATTPMKDAAIVIRDASGKELRRLPIPDGATIATVAWDGKDASGNPVRPGSYEVAVDQGSSSATISARWRGRVDALELTADGPRLRMGALLLLPADIRTIGKEPLL